MQDATPSSNRQFALRARIAGSRLLSLLSADQPLTDAPPAMKTVRISAKAIIIEDGKLLLIANRDHQGEWFMLPGGGQEYGETLMTALSRECVEETGSSVVVGPLRYIRDYIGKNHEFAWLEAGVHQVELMFECTLTSPPGVGSKMDSMQTGIRWIELAALAQHRVYPKVLAELLVTGRREGPPLYLGDTN